MGLLFDGTNDSVDFGDIADVDGATLTVCVWYNPTNTSALGIIWGKVAAAGGDADDIYLAQSDGAGGNGSGIQWVHGTTSPRASVASGVFTAGTWAHVAMVYDGSLAAASRVAIYINGAAQSLSITGTIPATIAASADTVRCGTDGANGVDLAGTLAHLKCWDAALTAAGVYNEMNSYRPVRTSNLFLWAPLDDGTAAKDYSGGGNAGTVAGAVAAGSPSVANGAVGLL